MAHANRRHSDEAQRLLALEDEELLDTPAEPYLDTLVRIAQGVFGVETVLVSLVDRQRQWFKARRGLSAAETPRDISFCQHAILQEQPMVINDAREDQQFHDNPLVTGPPHIRFYAGQRLFNRNGMALGTLCLIDSHPKTLQPAQVDLLKDMAILAEGYLKLRSVSRQSVQLKAAVSREQRKAMLDSLTQLWNRAGLMHFLPLQQKDAQQNGQRLGVLFCDLDHFKRVNDTFGHQGGDQVLWETARRIGSAVRPEDIVTRSGGEEFVVLTQVSEPEQLQRIAERIRHGIAERTVLIDDTELELTISVGTAIIRDGESTESLLHRADLALYQAKRNGRNRVEEAQ
jgi:diguanylate cyclase (GGDEF)-like protein